MHRRIRVYEIANQMGMDRAELASLLRSMGSPGVQNYMSLVDVAWLDRVREQLAARGSALGAQTRRRRLVAGCLTPATAPPPACLEQAAPMHPAPGGAPPAPRHPEANANASGIVGEAAPAPHPAVSGNIQPARATAPVGRPRKSGVEIWVGWKQQGARNRGAPRPKVTPAPTTDPARPRRARKQVVKLDGRISVSTLAARIGVSVERLMAAGRHAGDAVPPLSPGALLEAHAADTLARALGWTVLDRSRTEAERLMDVRGAAPPRRPEELPSRPPVIVVLGHIDHGKTTLLDRIRSTEVASAEPGGITQQIAGWRIESPHGPLTFLDTPGHEAFAAMRGRGLGVTDIVLLVVAADDGVMPQTRDAAQLALEAELPVVVAITKIDRPDANPDRAARQLLELGLLPDDVGGDTVVCRVSSTTGEGIDELLELLALRGALLGLRADPRAPARAVVLESSLDRGRGPVARALVTEGTLRVGDRVLCGPLLGKIRAMTDAWGRRLAEAGPGQPLELVGLPGLPPAGEALDAVRDARKALALANERRDRARPAPSRATPMFPRANGFTAPAAPPRAGQRAGQAPARPAQPAPRGPTGLPELRVALKAQTQGALEALRAVLSALPQRRVSLSVISASVGAITEGDVRAAAAGRATIVGLGVGLDARTHAEASMHGVAIEAREIIYDAAREVRSRMASLLPPDLVERALGQALVLRVFKVPGGAAAGCSVTEGALRRGAVARVVRADRVLHEGPIVELRRFREEAREIGKGHECGVRLSAFDAFQEGDELRVHALEPTAPEL
jgi:translation initiation factor IF-2